MPDDFDNVLKDMDFGALNQLITRATELRDRRRAEAMERLQKDAQLLGATVQDANGKKPRGRKPKQKHDE